MRRVTRAAAGAATGARFLVVIVLARILGEGRAEFAGRASVLILGARCGGQLSLQAMLRGSVVEREVI